MTSLGDRECPVTPDLSSTEPVPLGSDRGAVVRLGADSPCLTLPNGTKGTYARFQLPQDGSSVLLKITSDAGSTGGSGMIPPRAWLLDDAGKLSREIGFGTFRFSARESGLSTTTRVRPGETKLVVLSDPLRIGETRAWQFNEVLNRHGGSYQVASVIFIPVYTRPATALTVRFSYNGTIRVVAVPVPRVP